MGMAALLCSAPLRLALLPSPSLSIKLTGQGPHCRPGCPWGVESLIGWYWFHTIAAKTQGLLCTHCRGFRG